MPRLPLAAPIESRDGTVEKDGLCKNLLIEQDEGVIYSTLRPGLATIATSTGNGNGVVEFGGLLFTVFGTSLSEYDSGFEALATLEDQFFDFAQSTL